MKHLRHLAAAAACVLAAALAAPAAAATAGANVDFDTHVIGTYVGANGLGSVAFSINQDALASLVAGTGSGKADKLFADHRSLAASASESLDLAGVLADPLGATLTFAHVKALYVHAAAANTNDVCVGGAASNTFVGPFADATDVACVKPGGTLLVTAPASAGWTVTASTGDLLKVANSGGTTGVAYDVVIVGTSN